MLRGGAGKVGQGRQRRGGLRRDQRCGGVIVVGAVVVSCVGVVAVAVGEIVGEVCHRFGMGGGAVGQAVGQGGEEERDRKGEGRYVAEMAVRPTCPHPVCPTCLCHRRPALFLIFFVRLRAI